MQSVAEHYFQAALERIEDSRLLYSSDRFSYSLYTAGLAVECLLRAFHSRVDPVFDARHDLRQIFRASRFFDLEMERLAARGINEASATTAIQDLLAARDTVARFWRNDYRFMPERQLRPKLRALGAPQSKRGNQVKPCAIAVYNAAKLIVERGDVLWTFIKK